MGRHDWRRGPIDGGDFKMCFLMCQNMGGEVMHLDTSLIPICSELLRSLKGVKGIYGW